MCVEGGSVIPRKARQCCCVSEFALQSLLFQENKILKSQSLSGFSLVALALKRLGGNLPFLANVGGRGFSSVFFQG